MATADTATVVAMIDRSAIHISHDVASQRFVVTVDGEEAGFVAYAETAGTCASSAPAVRDLQHTMIYPAFRGKGLSLLLLEAVFTQCEKDDCRIIPTCSAVEHFLVKNPGWEHLVEKHPKSREKS